MNLLENKVTFITFDHTIIYIFIVGFIMERNLCEEDDSDVDIMLLMVVGSVDAYESQIPRPMRRQITKKGHAYIQKALKDDPIHFRQLYRMNPEVFAELCHLLQMKTGLKGTPHDAQSMFEETERLNLLADEKTYLAMSQVHLNSGNVVKALDVIEMMKTRDIPLSRFAYIVMLQCYAKIQNVDCAEEAFRALSKTGLPDASSCNDMLNLYTRLNLGEKAKGFIKQIMVDQVHFDIELYKTAMRVYCKEGMVAEAQDLIVKMGREARVKDNRFVQTLAESMHIVNKHDKHEAVLNVSQLDVMALGLMLNLRLKEGNLNETKAILNLMFKTDLGSSAVNRVISSFVREGRKINLVRCSLDMGIC